MMYNIPLLIRKILFQRQSADLAQHTASLMQPRSQVLPLNVMGLWAKLLFIELKLKQTNWNHH